jgi:hypothetical protein
MLAGSQVCLIASPQQGRQPSLFPGRQKNRTPSELLMPDWAITPGSSLALIGNAAEQTFGQSGPLIRGVFDKAGRKDAGVCGGHGVRGWNQLRNCSTHRLSPARPIAPRKPNGRQQNGSPGAPRQRNKTTGPGDQRGGDEVHTDPKLPSVEPPVPALPHVASV